MATNQIHLTKVENGSITTPLGFQADGLHSGVKRKRRDLGVIYSERRATAAAVYTTNAFQAAPITVTKESIQEEGKLQAVIVNSGNANACIGEQGLQDAFTMRRVTAERFNIPHHYVAVASTGVIGEQLPMDRIVPHIKQLKPRSAKENANHFNESILTTDLCVKTTCYEAVIHGKKVTMAGSAKGSGMIEPNMATMLSFITTDVEIEHDLLTEALREVTDRTFNCITVDGDTSTNDTVIVLANGMSGADTLTKESPDWPVFIELLRKTCEDLAKMIAKDGEGATKLIEVSVEGAEDNKAAVKIAKSVVGSSLVKTAVFGADANWGRIIAAIGYSGATVNPHTVDISLGPINLIQNSEPVEYLEEEATEYLNNEEIEIKIHLHVGDGQAKCWGCDLTYEYVRINASYRS